MTAVAIMKLVETGKVGLDQPVSRYLPQFRGWGAGVRIRHLLHHVGGLPDYYEDIEESYSRPTNRQALAYLARLAHLKFRPGRRFDYSNAGYDMLGSVIEQVSGQKFGAFMQSEIFAPAGMNSTFAFDSARRKASKRAIGYYRSGRRYEIDDSSPLNLLHGSGSIYSTIEDLLRYDDELFHARLTSTRSLEEIFTAGALSNGRSIEYGFGWDILKDERFGLDYYGHSGEWMGFTSYYLHYPAVGLSIILLSNSSDTDVETLAFDVAMLALPRLLSVPGLKTRADLSCNARCRRAGQSSISKGRQTPVTSNPSNN
jgi:CubicO group peptidase (beta-lactamase class C family)